MPFLCISYQNRLESAFSPCNGDISRSPSFLNYQSILGPHVNLTEMCFQNIECAGQSHLSFGMCHLSWDSNITCQHSREPRMLGLSTQLGQPEIAWGFFTHACNLSEQNWIWISLPMSTAIPRWKHRFSSDHRMSSNVGPSQYLDGWPPGNTGCCRLFFPPNHAYDAFSSLFFKFILFLNFFTFLD